MASLTRNIRKALDKARKRLGLPDQIELLKRAQSGPIKGGYAPLYTVTGGWMIFFKSEVIDHEVSRYINLIVTDDRDDLDEDDMQQVYAIKFRGRIYKRQHQRPSLTIDPAFWQVGFEATGEKAA